MLLPQIDRYMLRLTCGNFAAITGIIMMLLVLEHLPRLIDMTQLSGHRGYIVGQTLLALLPEYAGIGVLVALYLAFALAVRKLSLRGEIAVFEATGIRPLRWLRMPLLLTVLGAAFALLNVGWLQPYGEDRIAQLGERMARGEFGLSLAAGQFHEIADGTTLYFSSIDAGSGAVEGIMILNDQGTYSARSGFVSTAPDNGGIVQLMGGQMIENGGAHVMHFDVMVFRTNGPQQPAGLGPDALGKTPLSRQTLTSLLSSSSHLDQSAGFGRLLQVLLVLLTPIVAYSLARPPTRSSNPFGLVLGLGILIAYLKSISLIANTTMIDPVVDAVALAVVWAAGLALVCRLKDLVAVARIREGLARELNWIVRRTRSTISQAAKS